MRNHDAPGHRPSLAAVATTKGCLPNGGAFPDCFTFSLAPSCMSVSPVVSPPSTAVALQEVCHCATIPSSVPHHLSPPHHLLRHLPAHLTLHPHPISRNAFDRILGHHHHTPPVLFPRVGTIRPTHAIRQLYRGPCHSLGATSAFYPGALLLKAHATTAMDY